MWVVWRFMGTFTSNNVGAVCCYWISFAHGHIHLFASQPAPQGRVAPAVMQEAQSKPQQQGVTFTRHAHSSDGRNHLKSMICT